MTIQTTSKRMTVIHVVGEMDARAALAAPELVQLRASPPKCLRIDAGRATFIDSSGLAALAAVALSVRQQGGNVTMKASVAVRRVVELCGVAQHLGLRPSAASSSKRRRST